MFNIEVGIKIRELREKSKWSQAELGRKINKSKST
ncbi:MAG: helix-turn-helix domain-containing protein, partial [Dorea sp.]|nr:helix-turn-helix domain-containing protein [Dorea sp.]